MVLFGMGTWEVSTHYTSSFKLGLETEKRMLRSIAARCSGQAIVVVKGVESKKSGLPLEQNIRSSRLTLAMMAKEMQSLASELGLPYLDAQHMSMGHPAFYPNNPLHLYIDDDHRGNVIAAGISQVIANIFAREFCNDLLIQ
eukprot:TRINITY_DN1297_c0_g1_i1.p1 TRINITY_DN1297_c0_g1~~TRINITY_DN1297_c0_g1_i1.p1  ORF type:complete len:142 (-),score=15.83 TRINITY_DN1297_c0_g1_i1:9-434(-)